MYCWDISSIRKEVRYVWKYRIRGIRVYSCILVGGWRTTMGNCWLLKQIHIHCISRVWLTDPCVWIDRILGWRFLQGWYESFYEISHTHHLQIFIYSRIYRNTSALEKMDFMPLLHHYHIKSFIMATEFESPC